MNEKRPTSSVVEALYEDATVRVDEHGVAIKRYYFPTGAPKRFGYDEVASIEVLPAGVLTRWRLWGSTSLVNWLPLDTRRPRRDRALEFDLGKRVRPVITPDDPEQVAELIRARI